VFSWFIVVSVIMNVGALPLLLRHPVMLKARCGCLVCSVENNTGMT